MVRVLGGPQGSVTVTPRVGMGSPLRRRNTPPHSLVATGVIESPYGLRTITGTHKAIQRLSSGRLTSCVEEHLVAADPRETQKIRLRETQNHENLLRLSYLYEFPRTSNLEHGDELWVLSRISIHRGTIEQLEDEIFNVDELDTAAEVRLCIKRDHNILRLIDVDTRSLEKIEEQYGMQFSFAEWFNNVVGIGIPHPSLIHKLIDPVKLMRSHNRSHLEELYSMPFDMRMVNSGEMDIAIYEGTNWAGVETVGDIPEGVLLQMKALVNIEEGHEQGYIDSIFPAQQRIEFDDMKYGVALFTVEMRDRFGLIVNWVDPSDLENNGLDEDLVEKFKAQAVTVLEPSETSVRLAADNSLQTPANYKMHEPSTPSTAVSSLGYEADERDTLAFFAMDEASSIDF